MFNTSSKRVRQEGEKNSGGTIVDTLGYIPKEKVIQNLIKAGVRLEESRRRGQFDYYPGDKVDEDAEVDPTRRKDFDFAALDMYMRRASAAMQRLEERYKSLKKVEQEPQQEPQQENAPDTAPAK